MGAGGAVDSCVRVASAGRWHCSVGRSCGVHVDRVGADQRVCVAGSATVVRGGSSRPRTAASASGPKRGCGDVCTTRYWLNSEAGACSTGAARSWTAPAYGRKKGIHDRSQPGGPRRRKPAKLHADKAYDQTDLRRWVRNRGIEVRIARKGIESSQKLGKHRWVIKRTL
jgi:hypothetical protein